MCQLVPISGGQLAWVQKLEYCCQTWQLTQVHSGFVQGLLQMNCWALCDHSWCCLGSNCCCQLSAGFRHLCFYIFTWILCVKTQILCFANFVCFHLSIKLKCCCNNCLTHILPFKCQRCILHIKKVTHRLHLFHTKFAQKQRKISVRFTLSLCSTMSTTGLFFISNVDQHCNWLQNTMLRFTTLKVNCALMRFVSKLFIQRFHY